MRLRGDDMLDRHRLVLSDPLTGDSERTRSQAFEKAILGNLPELCRRTGGRSSEGRMEVMRWLHRLARSKA
jgi:hypothetical protein